MAPPSSGLFGERGQLGHMDRVQGGAETGNRQREVEVARGSPDWRLA